MIPDKAIEKAIEGGWIEHLNYERPYFEEREKPEGFKSDVLIWGTRPDGKREFTQYYYPEIALDPIFWQALGKSCGWQKQPYLCPGCQTIGTREGNHMNACPHKYRRGDWREEALEFYDLILTGGDTTAYWEEILPTNGEQK